MSTKSVDTIEDQEVAAPSTPPPGMALVDAASIGRAIGDALNANNPKKVSIGQYAKRGHSPFHPNGPTPKLTRPCYQNDVRVQPDTLFDEEIDLLNRITHSGRYFNRKVEVIVTDDGSDQSVQIRWACATPDQRFEMKNEFRDFRECLRGIVEAQEQEDEDMRLAEEETRQNRERRRRTFGQSKATQAAHAGSK